MKKLNFFLFVLLIGLFGCSNTPKFELGSVKDNVYINNFFSVTVKIPESWYIQSADQNKETMERGQQLINDENLKAQLKVFEDNSAALLGVFKYEPGSPVDYNPSFAICSENISRVPGIKNGKDYFYFVKKILQQSQIVYDEINYDLEPVLLGGKEFNIMSAKASSMGLSVRQTYYARKIGSFAFCIILSYGTDEQKAELEALLNTIEFK